MAQVAAIVRPGGFVGIKTPNIDCPEAEVFGPQYHSLKREHLGFFSPASLTDLAGRAGFEPVESRRCRICSSASSAPSRRRAWERELRGADIVAWYRRA